MRFSTSKHKNYDRFLNILRLNAMMETEIQELMRQIEHIESSIIDVIHSLIRQHLPNIHKYNIFNFTKRIVGIFMIELEENVEIARSNVFEANLLNIIKNNEEIQRLSEIYLELIS